MYKNLKWRILSILIVVFGAVALAYPLKEKISLGLDLQGGMHLVLEVKVEKAVEASLERFAYSPGPGPSFWPVLTGRGPSMYARRMPQTSRSADEMVAVPNSPSRE